MENILFLKEEPRVSSIIVEVPIANGAAKVALPDVQQLRSDADTKVIVKGWRLISPKVLTRGILNNAVNAALADLRQMALTIYSEGWERGQNIPVLLLNDANDNDSTAATTIPFRNAATKLADWKRVDFPKSFLQFANGQSASQACVVIFEIEYLKLDAQGRIILTAS